MTGRGPRVGTGGPWGTGLLILGAAVIVQGLGYSTSRPGQLPPALEDLSHIVPPWVTGAVWMAVGGFCVVRALRPPQCAWHILPVVGIFALWSSAHLMHWVQAGLGGDWNRSWTSALAWAMLAALIACWGRCVNPPAGTGIR